MIYKLSFCEIEQLSENIFEVTINWGAEIDEECAKEAELFWHELRRGEPYRLLVNNQNSFSYSFEGAQKIGAHPLEEFTAVLIDYDIKSKIQMEHVMKYKKMAGNAENRRVFSDRSEAMKWLETI